MKHCFLILLLIIWGTTPARAQKTIDLANLQFTENVQTLLKGVHFNIRKRDHQTVYYIITDKKRFTYAGLPINTDLEIGAQNNIVFSCYLGAGNTAGTNKLLQALLAKYRQPTKKVKDNADTKAYYWQTPTLFVQYMSGKNGYADNTYFTCFVHIASFRGFNAGADPDFKHVFDLFKAF
jgi:hypothetical protein